MSANIPPTCPDTHIFNQMACLCEPKKKALKGKKHKKKLILTAKHKKKLPLPKSPLPKTQKTKNLQQHRQRDVQMEHVEIRKRANAYLRGKL
jgi:hypothetical protein